MTGARTSAYCLAPGPAYHGCVSAPRPTILLTGFGPFPGVPENVSAKLVPRVAGAAERAFPGYRIHAEVLPTEWRAGPVRARELLEHLRPVLVVHFGVSGKATGLTLETRAQRTFRTLCDAAGRLPPAPDGEAPDMLRTTLPAALALERLRRLRIPAVLSRDAGGYLCNAVLYASLRRAGELNLSCRIGFVHVPHRLASDLPLSADERPRPSGPPYAGPVPPALSWQQATTGGLAVIATGIGRPLQRALQPVSGRRCLAARSLALPA
jgi:pyroglutamyl-peptidase